MRASAIRRGGTVAGKLPEEMRTPVQRTCWHKVSSPTLRRGVIRPAGIFPRRNRESGALRHLKPNFLSRGAEFHSRPDVRINHYRAAPDDGLLLK